MSTRTRVRSLIATAAVAATTVVAAPAAADPHSPEPGVVRTESGWLRGSVADDHVTYSAIPYAAPPVGDRRWRPPAQPRPWSGVRDATEPSPYCPQGGEDSIVGQENCLYLDVTAPIDDATRGKRLPVLVWLHGGGFNAGGAREFDGARLATRGDLVVVTVNYRLGALGFLSSPHLGFSGGNYGLMDQTAALHWVRRNIARFGGDPHNVTLAGQSAGARAVCAQLASPISWGLYDRAITQSGACDNRVPTLAEAREFGTRATGELGCTSASDVAACLRSRRPARLLDTLEGVGWEDVNGRVNGRPWNPVAGTWVLPWQPGVALRHGLAARVPLLVGGNRDEMRSFLVGEPVTPKRYHTLLTQTFGDEASAVLARYPITDYDSPTLALSAVLGDWGGSIGACPVLRTARSASAHQPVYAYEFAEDSGQDYGFPMGSYHGLELPYLWDLDLPWNPYPELDAEQRRLSATMIDYWSAFARTGDPNGPGRPSWPEFGSTDTVIELSAEGIAPTPYAADHRCGFWAELPR